MKNVKPISLSISAAIIFTFSLLSCNKAETAKSNDAPIESASSANFSQTSASTKPSAEDKSAESKDLTFLKKWVGKYPVNKGNKVYGNFFAVPQVKNILSGILGKDGFKNLLEHFEGSDLIEEKKGFLKVFGTTARDANQNVGYGLIAIKLTTGETHIFFADDEKLSAFGNTKGDGTLPIEIKESILIYTGEASLVGTIKQKPDEGYICYAVLYNDWDTPQNTRPYIFYITDSGGRMNIEGKDVELKRKSETEKKGEGGKTYVDWVYENKQVRAHFDMVVSEIPDSSAVVYDGTATVTTYSKTQTVQIKAFCGG